MLEYAVTQEVLFAAIYGNVECICRSSEKVWKTKLQLLNPCAAKTVLLLRSMKLYVFLSYVYSFLVTFSLHFIFYGGDALSS